MIWFYVGWIMVTIIVYAWSAHASIYNNNHTGWKSAAYLYMFNLYPGWILVSRYSKNILFDGILYDSIMFLSFTLSMTFLTNSQTPLTIYQWVGLSFIIFGMILMKV